MTKNKKDSTTDAFRGEKPTSNVRVMFLKVEMYQVRLKVAMKIEIVVEMQEVRYA